MTIWDGKFQNATPPTVFIPCYPNYMKTLLTMGNTGNTFIGNPPSFKKLQLGIQWENLNMQYIEND